MMERAFSQPVAPLGEGILLRGGLLMYRIVFSLAFVAVVRGDIVITFTQNLPALYPGDTPAFVWSSLPLASLQYSPPYLPLEAGVANADAISDGYSVTYYGPGPSGTPAVEFFGSYLNGQTGYIAVYEFYTLAGNLYGSLDFYLGAANDPFCPSLGNTNCRGGDQLRNFRLGARQPNLRRSPCSYSRAGVVCNGVVRHLCCADYIKAPSAHGLDARLR
jgi:hypothetical protein